MLRHKHKVWLVLLLLTLSGNALGFSASESRTYRQTRKLLSQMKDVKNDSDRLAALFKVADQRIDDLIQALDDQNREISRSAQIVIRYSGNAKGMKALTDWYGMQPNEYPVVGPIPLPLSDWDYKFINTNVIGKPPEMWGDLGVRYIYALAVDGSQQSSSILDAIVKKAGAVDESTFLGYAINRVRTSRTTKLLTSEKDLARPVLKNAFFLSPEDHKEASARFLGINGDKDKALIEVYINRGRLAEEWYHIVIMKHGQGWKFFSITPVAVS
jgi:hypothetical protein